MFEGLYLAHVVYRCAILVTGLGSANGLYKYTFVLLKIEQNRNRMLCHSRYCKYSTVTVMTAKMFYYID